MASEYLFPFYVLLGGAVSVAVGFTFQPLTEDDATRAGNAEHQARMHIERSFCHANLRGVNCGCFVQKSTYVSSFDAPKIFGARYVDSRDLAREQARNSC